MKIVLRGFLAVTVKAPSALGDRTYISVIQSDIFHPLIEKESFQAPTNILITGTEITP